MKSASDRRCLLAWHIQRHANIVGTHQMQFLWHKSRQRGHCALKVNLDPSQFHTWNLRAQAQAQTCVQISLNKYKWSVCVPLVCGWFSSWKIAFMYVASCAIKRFYKKRQAGRRKMKKKKNIVNGDDLAIICFWINKFIKICHNKRDEDDDEEEEETNPFHGAWHSLLTWESLAK